MELLVVSCLLALVVGGCVCIVWAARGGPRWVRVVAAVTRTAGELLSAAGRSSGRKSSGDSDSGD
jgi:hypothetical protein